jgi:hypothetical protein
MIMCGSGCVPVGCSLVRANRTLSGPTVPDKAETVAPRAVPMLETVAKLSHVSRASATKRSQSQRVIAAEMGLLGNWELESQHGGGMQTKLRRYFGAQCMSAHASVPSAQLGHTPREDKCKRKRAKGAARNRKPNPAIGSAMCLWHQGASRDGAVCGC